MAKLFEVKLKKTRKEVCTLLVEGDTKEKAEQLAMSQSRYAEWTLSDVNTVVTSVEDEGEAK